MMGSRGSEGKKGEAWKDVGEEKDGKREEEVLGVVAVVAIGRFHVDAEAAC